MAKLLHCSIVTLSLSKGVILNSFQNLQYITTRQTYKSSKNFYKDEFIFIELNIDLGVIV